MNILFLIEDLDNKTALNLVSAMRNTGHKVDVVPYFSANKNQCSIVGCPGNEAIIFENQIYSPLNYDAALLWCWGTASLGRKYLRIFEDQGVSVLNSTYRTDITDSKIKTARVLEKENISIPKTLCFDSGFSISDICNIKDSLGEPPYVFKPDYGTQGLQIRFAMSESEVKSFASDLRHENPEGLGFIVQEFIGDPDVLISHYRILVIGDTILPAAIKATAIDKLNVSNISAGGLTEMVPIHNELKKVAIHAAKASGLRVAGVDIMVKPRGKKEDIVVLELNDGPGTKTFDRNGFYASQAIVDFFINDIETTAPNINFLEQVRALL